MFRARAMFIAAFRRSTEEKRFHDPLDAFQANEDSFCKKKELIVLARTRFIKKLLLPCIDLNNNNHQLIQLMQVEIDLIMVLAVSCRLNCNHKYL
jgi:hypothetical protein